MATATETFKSLSTGGLKEIPKNIADAINSILTSLLPNNELWLVLGFAILFAWLIKKRANMGLIPFILLIFVFWSALRFWQIGG